MCKAIKISIDDLDYDLFSIIVKEYKRNPIPYAYVYYDMIYELDKTHIIFKISNRRILGYILLWRGMKPYAIHVYGDVEGLLDKSILEHEAIVHVPPELNESATVLLRKYGDLKFMGIFLDMLADSSSFLPYFPDKAIRLGKEHVKDYTMLKKEQGIVLSEDEAFDRLIKWRYYGVYYEGKLVSIACAYLRLPEIWIIGDVYTLKEYRGRGYAKIVTSAITRDAIYCSGKALLHVREDNISAIRVYSRLGYRIIGKKYWYLFKPYLI